MIGHILIYPTFPISLIYNKRLINFQSHVIEPPRTYRSCVMLLLFQCDGFCLSSASFIYFLFYLFLFLRLSCTMSTNKEDYKSNTLHNDHTNSSANDQISDEDYFYMRQALKVAKNALAVGEVPVGCVLVLVNHPSLPSQSITEQQQSVIVSHGANQVNATRDATRHAEIVAVDRLLTCGVSSDQLRLPPTIGTKAAPGSGGIISNNGDQELQNNSSYSGSTSSQIPDAVRKSREEQWEDEWINVPEQLDHWKNSYGWRRNKPDFLQQHATEEIFRYCHLYVTCEPCIMCAAALATVGIRKVIFGCKNERFGGCGSLLHLHQKEDLDTIDYDKQRRSLGYEIASGVLEEEAITLLRSFYDRENFHAPDHKRKRKEEKT